MADIVREPIGIEPVEPIVVKPVISDRTIIKTADSDVVIDYNAVARKASVVSLSEAEKELKEAQERLDKLPTGPTDEELLAWSKENYPMMDYSAERMELERIIAEKSAVLGMVR